MSEQAGETEIKRSPEDLLAELEGDDASERADDSGAGINLFDYLVKSTTSTTTKMESRTSNDLSFSSVHSSASTASRRRRQLRVKRYTEEGEEDTNNIPHSAVPYGNHEGAASLSSFSSLNASGRSFRSQEGEGGSKMNRSGRIKRYQARDLQPSTISSHSEEDDDEAPETLQSSSTPSALSPENNVESESLPNIENGPLSFAQIRAQIAQSMSKPTNDDEDFSGSESSDSFGSLPDELPPLSIRSKFDPTLKTQHSRNMGERVSVRMGSSGTENEPEEEDVITSSQRARESIYKRQAAALAVAATIRRTELNETKTSEVDGEESDTKLPARKKSVQLPNENGGYNSPPKDDAAIRSIRRKQLEERKRKLEALARAASMQRESKYIATPSIDDPSLLKKKSTRTVNIDVYTGEVIGEMPKIGTLLGEGRGRDDDDADSSSSYSSTEYDIPAAKGRGHMRLFIVLLLLIGTGFGVYFGIYFNSDKDDRKSSNERNIPLVVETPVPSPAPLTDVSSNPVSTLPPSSPRRPSSQPSFLTSRTPSEKPSVDPLGEQRIPTGSVPLTLSPTTTHPSSTSAGEGTSAPSLSLTMKFTPIPENVNQELFELLVQEWPTLPGVIEVESSPQLRALQWLSSDEGLSSYSIERKKQRFALGTFFYSTDGDNWTRSDQWLSSANECLWFTSTGPGLQCNAAGMYTSLEINFNNLNGSIPAELGLLSGSLKAINLIRMGDGPLITGAIPSELGLLSELESVDFRGNQLEGRIPSEIGNLSELSRLRMQGNELSGQLPSEIGLLTKLRSIDLENNLIDGTLPPEIGNVALLESLLLSNNQISGSIPTQLGSLTSVTTFSADYNAFTSIPSEIGNLAVLSSLRIAGNKLGGNIPSEIGSLTSLLRLVLSRNLLSGTIPSTLGNLALLRDNLDLSSNQLSGPIPLEFGRLLLLRQLLLHSNQLTGEIPSSFRALGRLSKSTCLNHHDAKILKL
jgi:hypothetical protein